MSESVLVIGGGIAGIQASLDLAGAGAEVVLIEREATIGGVMSVLDKNFPTLDCSICIEAPKMSEVELHPKIEILTLSEIESVTGSLGNFSVQISQKARFVTDECTRCGDCTLACPEIFPNEFDSGMATRKAIFTPIPQSIPGAYLIDMDSCLNDPPNYTPCNRCYQVCPPKAINFLMPNIRYLKRNVGSIIVSVGYDMFDPRELKKYGYGTHPDILTAMEYERLINSAGPTGGEIVCPSNGEHPDNILFVLCVGSRDHRYQHYCSRFCCMYSIKHAYQALDHGVNNATVLYMDIRAYGKGFDGFWERTKELGAEFIRGHPYSIQNQNGKILVNYEDIENRIRVSKDFDMVVLANAVLPQRGISTLAECLKIDLDYDGFIKCLESQGGLVTTTRPGVYVAGCASGPKDIPDCVAEGSAAAALAMGYLTSRSWSSQPIIKTSEKNGKFRIGVFVCHCGNNIAGVIDVEKVVRFANSLNDVVYADHQMFSCAGNSQTDIENAIKLNQINRVVIAACSPKTHENIFHGVMLRSDLNPYLMVMANIRNMDSWVHKYEPQNALDKAKDMVAMAVEHARLLKPLVPGHLKLTPAAIVVGGGIAGMTAATTLAKQGFETHLIEKEKKLGGMLNKLDVIYPAGIPAKNFIDNKLKDICDSGVIVHLKTEIITIHGFVGNFTAVLSNDRKINIGAIVIATGAGIQFPSENRLFTLTEYPPCTHNFSPKIDQTPSRLYGITNLKLDSLLAEGKDIAADRITFISCVESRDGNVGCSRYCCTSMVGQALKLRRMGKHVRIVSKDIRTYSRHSEELYEMAMRNGIQFFRYDPEKSPQTAITIHDDMVHFFDHNLGSNLALPTDLLIYVVGLRPIVNKLAEQLKLSRSEDGFYLELHPKLGPVETSSQGIFLAGSAQGAKDVRESIAQGMATAAKAGKLLARGEIEKEPITAQLIPELCKGCMRCTRVCPFNAIEAIDEPGEKGAVQILDGVCMGCGTCAAECNFDAIVMPYFTKEQILAQVDAALINNPRDKCIVFTCNWCSYAGADLAGIEKRQYPASSRIIRTMCSGRYEEDFISRAFEKDAGAVLITGCRLTETGSDCHYNYANKFTEKRFKRWVKKYQRKGIDPNRLQLQWISAAEAKEFAEKLYEMDDIIQRIKI